MQLPFCLPLSYVLVKFHRGCRDAIYRIAYEFCEDSAKHNIKYVETRYCPHLLANTAEKREFAIKPGDISPRDVVDIVCTALEKGSKDFNITVKSILCSMTHRPGNTRLKKNEI